MLSYILAKNMDISLFKKLGFPDKSATIYLALLRLGPSSVRSLAEKCEINRGTTYDALKWLQEEGVVNYYQKDTKQFFVAEDPEKLKLLLEMREKELNQADKELDKLLPELQALHHSGGERPVAKYVEGHHIADILEDVLATCEQNRDLMYRIYSTAGLREYLYKEFPTFSDVRVSKRIAVRAIAIGDGGELRGFDERKWLKGKNETPTYIIIYPGKTAYISLNAKGEPVGVVIENRGVYETQKQIFDELWNKL